MNIICKIFGHKVVGLNTKRFFATCGRCHKGLKCSYDYRGRLYPIKIEKGITLVDYNEMSYGNTIVVGDYGEQKTFCWCDCGNELCSTDSLVSDTFEYGVEYKCSKCGATSNWCFDAPSPYRIKDTVIPLQAEVSKNV